METEMPSEEQGKEKATMNNQQARIGILYISGPLGCFHVLENKQIKAF